MDMDLDEMATFHGIPTRPTARTAEGMFRELTYLIFHDHESSRNMDPYFPPPVCVHTFW